MMTFSGPRPFVDCLNELVAAAQAVVSGHERYSDPMVRRKRRLREAIEKFQVCVVLCYETEEDAAAEAAKEKT